MRKFVLAAAVVLLCQGLFAEQYHYSEKTAADQAELVYKFQTNTELGLCGFTVYSPITKQTHQIDMDKNFATLKWINTKADGSVDTYTRDGNKLTAEVVRNGKKVKVTRTIDEMPWYASMEFGLGQFFRGGKNSVQFWNIHPETLKAHRMTAEIIAREKIDVNGTSTPVMKVRVTINGIPALFFNFLYWFREEDGLFVRFEGAKGPPGTPKTTMTFVKID